MVDPQGDQARPVCDHPGETDDPSPGFGIAPGVALVKRIAQPIPPACVRLPPRARRCVRFFTQGAEMKELPWKVGGAKEQVQLKEAEPLGRYVAPGVQKRAGHRVGEEEKEPSQFFETTTNATMSHESPSTHATPSRLRCRIT